MAFSLSKAARYRLEADPVERSDGFQEAPGVRFAVAAVASLLRRAALGDLQEELVSRALLHTLVSVDAPRADRVHLQLRWRGEVRPFRDVVPLLARWPKQGIGGAIERVETGARWFDVDAKEAFSRVVSTYTISYSNFMPYAPTVRARFFNDSPETQQGFLRAFLDLYDEDTDVTHLKGADAAAAWLREHRVCRAQQTLVLRDDVDDVVRPVDVSALELELREALAAFAGLVDGLQRVVVAEFRTSPRYHPAMARLTDAQLPTDLQPFVRLTQTLVTGAPGELSAGLVELLTELQVPPGLRALSALAVACVPLTEEPMPYEPSPTTQAALPSLLAAQERLKRATAAALANAC